MRGSLWSTLVIAVGVVLFVGAAWQSALPTNPTSDTEGVISILSAMSAFAGQYLLLFAVGTFVTLFIGRHVFAGASGGL